MATYWTNFAKFDDPNGDWKTNNWSIWSFIVSLFRPSLERWPIYKILNSTVDDLQRAYLELNADTKKMTVSYNYRSEFSEFRLSLIPKLA